MIIERVSEYSGVRRAFDLDITPEQIKRYMMGTLVQHAFPNLDDDEREFFLTGITAEEWDEMFEEEVERSTQEEES